MKVTLSRTETKTIECSDRELHQYFKRVKDNLWTATHIDGKEIECFCIYCNKPLFDSSEYEIELEGEAICNECIKKQIKE